MNPPALLIKLEAVQAAVEKDGERKILVTKMYPREIPATEIAWSHQASSGKRPVLLTTDTESGVFTQAAKQTRHFHGVGTELYMVLEGTMTIEVEGDTFTLSSGDAIVVLPGACHYVQRDKSSFLCRTITVNCGGESDKYDVDSDGHPVSKRTDSKPIDS
jgi:quercetin dioxygenase-like cupin family protein